MLNKYQLLDRLTTIRDSIDTDFLNRQEIEGVTKDINDLMVDINNEVNNNIDIDLDVSAEHQMSKYRELNKDLYEYRNNPARQRDERNEKKA